MIVRGERPSIVDNDLLAVDGMGAHSHACQLELRFENVFSVASAGHPIVNIKLNHVVFACLFTVGDVFTNRTTPVPIPFHAVPRLGAVSAVVTC